jgi:hypothetical protein
MSTTNLTSSASTRYIVRPIDGPNQVYDNVRADATVGHLKERIFVGEGIPVEDQKLIFASEILEGQSLGVGEILPLDAKQPITDHRTLESYHIAQVPLSSQLPVEPQTVSF